VIIGLTCSRANVDGFLRGCQCAGFGAVARDTHLDVRAQWGAVELSALQQGEDMVAVDVRRPPYVRQHLGSLDIESLIGLLII
jgi:hypothetical protein